MLSASKMFVEEAETTEKCRSAPTLFSGLEAIFYNEVRIKQAQAYLPYQMP